jgi:hypothetical protein
MYPADALGRSAGSKLCAATSARGRCVTTPVNRFLEPTGTRHTSDTATNMVGNVRLSVKLAHHELLWLSLRSTTWQVHKGTFSHKRGKTHENILLRAKATEKALLTSMDRLNAFLASHVTWKRAFTVCSVCAECVECEASKLARLTVKLTLILFSIGL